jgi:hypothetical protein
MTLGGAACAPPRASERRKSKTVAGRQGRALVDRSADPVREKCTDPHGCPGRRDSLEIAEITVMVAAGWTEAQKRAYVLADNQLAITGSGWDPELLRGRSIG